MVSQLAQKATVIRKAIAGTDNVAAGSLLEFLNDLERVVEKICWVQYPGHCYLPILPSCLLGQGSGIQR